MHTINVSLPESWLADIAQKAAKLIHDRVIQQHLELIGHGLDSEYPRQSISEIRGFISSLGSRDRWMFVGLTRHYFQKIRSEKFTDIRGRDYVARVKAADMKRAA